MLRRLIESHLRALATVVLAVALVWSGWWLLQDSPLVPASYDWTLKILGRSQAPANYPVILVYLDIDSYLDKIAAIDYNVWHQRPVLKKWEKAALVGGVLWERIWRILGFRY